MADDAARGVVDDAGAVHGYPGLHVLDGSIVPTSLGVNPSKTIAALAERGVERLVERLS
jgi:cholesterol oxidase